MYFSELCILSHKMVYKTPISKEQLMGDGQIDGKFVITNGGITHGIAEELGLSSSDCKKLGSIWLEIIKEFDNSDNMKVQNNNNVNPNSNNNYMVHQNAVVQFSKECWNKIVNLVNSTLDKNIQVEEPLTEQPPAAANSTTEIQAAGSVEELTQEQTARLEEHKQIVEKSIQLLKQNWELSDLGNHFKTEEDKALFLQCLDEVVYDARKTGAGHAEKGIIHIETDNPECNNLTQMTKLLIHEANHAFLQRKATQNRILNFPTKAEEIECETLALTSTCRLIYSNPAEYDDYRIYGRYVSEYVDASILHNTPEFKNWLNGYQQLADNLRGDVTIRHSPYKSNDNGTVELKSGDIITIQGETPRVIGSSCFIEGRSDTAIAQMIMHHKDFSTPDSFGDLIFDNLPATDEEFKQEYGESFDINNFEKVPFTVSRKNPQTGEAEVVYTGVTLRGK